MCDAICKIGILPNFIRSDEEVWKIIVSALRDEEFDNLGAENSTVRDTPFSSALPNKFWTNEDIYPSLMSDFCDFKTKIKLQLWRYNKMDIIEGSEITASHLGNWVNLLCPDARRFLNLSVSASQSFNSVSNSWETDHFIRSVFYGVVQAADCELTERVSIPFKNFLPKTNDDDMKGDYEEFKLFITGNYPPALGAMGKFLDCVRKNPRQDQVTSAFLDFAEQSDYLDIEDLTNKRFIQKLYQLGRLRGSIMHPDKVNIHDSTSTLNYLIDYKYPGEFFFKIGIDKAY